MTDKEIIKYLEQSIDEYDKNEIFVGNIRLDKLSLALINRKQEEYNNLLEKFRILDCECERLEKADENQKAEIKGLKIENQSLRSAANSYKIHYGKAVRDFEEFAQRAYIDNPFACQYCVHSVGDGKACLWKEEHEKDGESCLGKQFKYDLQKMVGKGL